MDIVAGKCAKSGKLIAKNGLPRSNYSEQRILLDNGSILCIGVDKDEAIEESDFDELNAAIEKYCGVNAKAKALVDRVSLVERLWDIQDGKCALTGKELDKSNYVFSSGKLVCP